VCVRDCPRVYWIESFFFLAVVVNLFEVSFHFRKGVNIYLYIYSFRRKESRKEEIVNRVLDIYLPLHSHHHDWSR